jgi:acetate kinase
MNAGSSSLKAALLDGKDLAHAIASGQVERIGSTQAAAVVRVGGAREVPETPEGETDHPRALGILLRLLDEALPGWRAGLVAVGHRVVHGGRLYTAPTVITGEVEKQLNQLRELAPLHNGPALAVIREALSALDRVPHVACFDTAFHRDLPPESARYALPTDLCARFGIRRYGFHGLSCTWSMQRLRELDGRVPDRVIICHLGAGASATAVLKGRSFDTSMGFTPLEGLIMATRSGSIDPSIVPYLQRRTGMSAGELEETLEKKSGLLSLSGRTGDVQELERLADSGDLAAEQALASFAYRVRGVIGAYWAVLGGLDAVVFTGGIGEGSPRMRERIAGPLAALGIGLDASANEGPHSQDRRIGETLNGPAVWVIHAREDRVIAAQVVESLSSSGGVGT